MLHADATGLERLYGTDITSSSYALSAASGWQAAQPAGCIEMGKYRGAKIRIIGDADGQVVHGQVFRVVKGRNADRSVAGYEYQLLGSFTSVIGTGAGAANTLVGASERFADTLVWTLAAAGTALATAHPDGGVATAISPEDNTVAMLIIPDVYDADELCIDIKRVSGGTDCNVLVELSQ